MLRQLIMLTQAVYALHRAAQEAHRAREIRAVAETRLREVADRLPPVGEAVPGGRAVGAGMAGAVRVAAVGQVPARPLGSPVPGRIEPARQRQSTTPGKERGRER